MFSTIVLHSGSTRTHRLRYLIAGTELLQIIRDYDNCMSDHELKRIVQSLEPEVVVIDLESSESLVYAAMVREVSPKSAVIGFGPTLEASLVATKLDFDATVREAATAEEMRTAIQDSLRTRQGGVEKSLFCFLPAKAGSGCSTIVLNTAAAMAKDQGKRVLVMDTDLRSGILGLMLGLEPATSIQNLLSAVQRLDKSRFQEFVTGSQGVDFLVSSRQLNSSPPEWTDYFHLLAMARTLYDAILVDMPELINPATVELVRRAGSVFLVTTPEIPSLKLTQDRLSELEQLNIPRSRMQLLVNRWHKSDPSTERIAAMVKHPVTRVFPNDYLGVRSAILSGKPVSELSKLGNAYTEFAGELFGKITVHDHSLTGKLKSFWGIRETVTAS